MSGGPVPPALFVIWIIVVIIGVVCQIACYGGIGFCIYYAIKGNQNQRTAAMAQHQMAYQSGMSKELIN